MSSKPVSSSHVPEVIERYKGWSLVLRQSLEAAFRHILETFFYPFIQVKRMMTRLEKTFLMDFSSIFIGVLLMRTHTHTR